MNPYIKCIIALGISCAPLTGFANDTAGTTSAGGIVFVKSPQISMEDEVLAITPTRIKVSYHFKNSTAQPVRREIYFPLPPYKMQGANAVWDEEIDPQLKTRNNIPFIDFTVKVNGQPVHCKTVIRAIYNNKDITLQLKKAQIPLNPELVAGNMPLDSSEQSRQLEWLEKARRMGLVDNRQQPRWQKQIFYTWQQIFPARSTITIEHEYRPATGVFYSLVEPDQTAAARIAGDLQSFKTIFNIAIERYQGFNSFKQWLMQRLHHEMDPHCKDCSPDRPYAIFFNIDYILTTGANWSGPIKNFTLTVAYPDNASIACNRFYGQQIPVVKETKGVRQFYIRNFIPRQNLSLVFGLAGWPKGS